MKDKVAKILKHGCNVFINRYVGLTFYRTVFVNSKVPICKTLRQRMSAEEIRCIFDDI